VTSATEDVVVEADVSALEFMEAAWSADEEGRTSPDASALSDPALFAVLRYARSDLPSSASAAVEAEATRRGMIATWADRWVPLAMLGMIVLSGLAIVGELLIW
jgi:hypothetical protein